MVEMKRKVKIIVEEKKGRNKVKLFLASVFSVSVLLLSLFLFSLILSCKQTNQEKGEDIKVFQSNIKGFYPKIFPCGGKEQNKRCVFFWSYTGNLSFAEFDDIAGFLGVYKVEEMHEHQGDGGKFRFLLWYQDGVSIIFEKDPKAFGQVVFESENYHRIYQANIADAVMSDGQTAVIMSLGGDVSILFNDREIKVPSEKNLLIDNIKGQTKSVEIGHEYGECAKASISGSFAHFLIFSKNYSSLRYIMIDKLYNVIKEFVGWDKFREDVKLEVPEEEFFLNITGIYFAKLSSLAYPSIETTKFPGYPPLIFGFYDLSTIWIMNPRTEKITVEYMKPVSGIGEFCSISASQNIPFVWAYDRQSNSLVFLKRNSDWSWGKEEVEGGAGWGISSFIFGTIPCAAYLSMVEGNLKLACKTQQGWKKITIDNEPISGFQPFTLVDRENLFISYISFNKDFYIKVAKVNISKALLK
jgi:hypothetical protein